jgi:alkylated DNA repair dioxygenase AlkB
METLFTTLPHFPEGFRYFPEFITEKEESDLLEFISPIPLHNLQFQGFEAKRKVASFGYDYSFEKRSMSKGIRIPVQFDPFIEKVAGVISLEKEDIAELLVTEYPVGAVINWHRDAPPFDIIAGISLRSECKFRLRPHEALKRSRGSILSFEVARRSLYVMQGPSRADWQHSIAPVKAVRYSITLRTLRQQIKE